MLPSDSKLGSKFKTCKKRDGMAENEIESFVINSDCLALNEIILKKSQLPKIVLRSVTEICSGLLMHLLLL